MNADEPKALQAPLKQEYQKNPGAALVTASLHAATGGNGLAACSGDMLLEALVACAGVTVSVSAVATAIGLDLRGGTVSAEGICIFAARWRLRRTRWSVSGKFGCAQRTEV